jgi:hypothetical protein
MGQLYVGGPVPGKKRRNNPWTMSGRPAWNTFAGLGIESTAKQINRLRRAQFRDEHKGVAGTQYAGGPAAISATSGGKSRVKQKRPLDKGNIVHRAKERMDRARGTFDQLRVLSLEIDRLTGGRIIDEAMKLYREMIMDLQQLRAHGYINELIRVERARGVVRAKLCL